MQNLFRIRDIGGLQRVERVYTGSAIVRISAGFSLPRTWCLEAAMICGIPSTPATQLSRGEKSEVIL